MNILADRNLLLGIIALQKDFISRDGLIAAMNAWVLEKTRPLAEILLIQKAITGERCALLEALVNEHIIQHGNDLQRSLAAVSSLESIRSALEQIADADIQATLAFVRPGTDGNSCATDTERTSSPTLPLRFRIMCPWREGGLGIVSVARDEELHRDVALKEIKHHHADNAQSRSRFLMEAEITGALEHPGIVPVYGLGKYDDGRPFYAMRFVSGDSLQEAVVRFHQADDKAPRNSARRTVAFRELLGRFISVCNAMSYAHSRGVLHRDLKPSNILLGRYGETLVVDWGLAKVLGEEEQPDSSIDESPIAIKAGSDAAPTKMGTLVGTPAYMSPEQAGGRLDLLGPASDVYSLGATLYCVLTGSAPVMDPDLGVVLEKVRRGEFRKPRQVNRAVPTALEAICLKAMALKPEDRYINPGALADDLERWLADERVLAYPEPLNARVRRWGRRHRGWVIGAAVLLITGLISLSTGIVLLANKQAEIKQERNAAIAARDSADRAMKQALHSAAQADSRYFLQKSELAPALNRAADAYDLGGKFEDGLLIDDVVKASRRNWSLRTAIQPGRGAESATATFTSADGKNLLVVASGTELQAFEARTGNLLATASADFFKHVFAPRRPAEGLVVAQSERQLTAYRLPTLQVASTRKFDNNISVLSASEHELLVMDVGSVLRILDFQTLEDRAETTIEGNYANYKLEGGAISPDGSMVALISNSFRDPTLIWDPKTNKLSSVPLVNWGSEADFITDSVVASWISTSHVGAADDSLVLVDLSSLSPHVTDRIEVSGIDTKKPLQLQGWRSDGKSMLGLFGKSGVLICRDGKVSDSVRYNNLWPFESEQPKALCASLSDGLLALRLKDKVLVFERKKDDVRLENCCATSITTGTVIVTPSFRLTYRPYALIDDEKVVQLQVPLHEHWIPWAVAATPDGGTVALVVQETESGELGKSTVGDKFRRTQVIVYHPGGWSKANEPEAWRVQSTIDLVLPLPTRPWDFRECALAADGSVFCYATIDKLVRHAIDGKLLGRFDDWRVKCRSPDGNLMAGVSPDGMIRILNVADGRITDLQRRPGVMAMCFAPDNAALIVGDRESLVRYSLSKGDVEWSIPSTLLPLAWPAAGDRFVAWQSDASGSTGNVVQADRNSGQFVTILSQAGSISSSSAAFSPDERQIVLREIGRGGGSVPEHVDH